VLAASIEALAKGRVDILFNGAGYVHAGTILDCDEVAFDFSFDLNVRSMYRLIRAFLPPMLAAGGGSIINVASFVATLGAATPQIAYTASKGAVLSMTRELAVEFARQGVRVNALCPGPVETPLLMRLFADDPAAYERRRVHLPMGRLAKPEEIARGALFLASDDSSYVTGTTFLVDGGLTAAYVTPE
jgi:NAD(P)-dependent dehydrogenase (short-subunit alcohol dehydrogenase family)